MVDKTSFFIGGALAGALLVYFFMKKDNNNNGALSKHRGLSELPSDQMWRATTPKRFLGSDVPPQVEEGIMRLESDVPPQVEERIHRLGVSSDVPIPIRTDGPNVHHLDNALPPMKVFDNIKSLVSPVAGGREYIDWRDPLVQVLGCCR